MNSKYPHISYYFNRSASKQQPKKVEINFCDFLEEEDEQFEEELNQYNTSAGDNQK
jgi:hypothetical protein